MMIDKPSDAQVADKIEELVVRGGLFVANHSAGKDSQAMFIKLREIVPPRQLIAIHADLGHVEWAGCKEHIRQTIGDTHLIVCRNERRTFLEMVAQRGMFPSPQQRQCTSDLKRNPISREIRRYLKAHPEFGGIVVNCMGLRADESPNRAKASAFKFSEGNSIDGRGNQPGREWYDWLPIHAMPLEEVWRTIADAGETPHPAYAAGMKRLSCKICIMASDEDLRTSAMLDPVNFKIYVMLEKRIGRTIMMPRKGVPRTLEEITGLNADDLLMSVGIDPADIERRFDVDTGLVTEELPTPSFSMAA